MAEEVKDVNTVEASTTEPQVEQTAEPTQQEQTTEAPVTTPPPAPTVSDVDEFGVPWKNRAAEWRRKTEELTEKLPQMIDEKLSNFSQTGQRKYTVDELEAFATQTDNPTYAQWARSEIRKLDHEEGAKVVREELGKWRKEQEDGIKRQQAYNYVVQNYPDVFVKSPTGQILGFNNQNPLMQQIDVIMRDPRFANDPEGLIAAADIGWARLQRSQQPIMQQEQQKLKEEVRDLQKKTLVEGGGKTATPAIPAHRAALEKLKQTGSMKDAQRALESILAAKRQSEEQE